MLIISYGINKNTANFIMAGHRTGIGYYFTRCGGSYKPVSLFGGKLLLMELNIYPSKYLSYLKKEEGDALLNNLLLACLVGAKTQNQAVEFQSEMIRKSIELLKKDGDFMFKLNAK